MGCVEVEWWIEIWLGVPVAPLQVYLLGIYNRGQNHSYALKHGPESDLFIEVKVLKAVTLQKLAWWSYYLVFSF